LTSRWRVKSAEDPRLAADRAALAWSQSSTPAGLLASSVFISADARALVRISQWRDDEQGDSEAAAVPVSARPSQPAPPPRSRGRALVPISEPSVEHLGTRLYRPYRSGLLRRPDEEPGVLVVVELDLGAPGRAQDWVELILAAVEADGPPTGLLGGHFYVSDDGRRAVNLAEWVSTEAHRDALDADGGFFGGGAAWERVRSFAEGKVKAEHYTFLRTTVHAA
jgi:hypothetical protein